MGKLICIIGKSSSGKDTLFKSIIRDPRYRITPIIPCTTRPMRMGETDGIDYHFVSLADLQTAESQNEILEKRTYNTIRGLWHYFTKRFRLGHEKDISMIITTPHAIKELAQLFGANHLIVVYLETDDFTRMHRSLEREKRDEHPNYREVCRRFLADEQDFSSFLREDFRSYHACYTIDSNQSISDCLEQFHSIYIAILDPSAVSETNLFSPAIHVESPLVAFCTDYIASETTEYPDIFSNNPQKENL